MARIPLPNRGQPLDTNYIYEMAKTINELSEDKSDQNFIFIGKDTIKRSSKIYGTQIYASVKTLSAQNVNVAETYPLTFDFQPGFAYPPVVQVTIENAGETNTVANATINVQNVTTTSATAVVKFATGGSSSINVHLTAIGLPIS